MAELTPKTINELPLASGLGANDLIPISSGGEAKRLPGSAIAVGSETHTFTTSLAAGTIGTRAAQLTWTPTHPVAKLESIVITYISSSSGFFPLIFVYDGQIYCNFYRADSYAVQNAVVSATFYFRP